MGIFCADYGFFSASKFIFEGFCSFELHLKSGDLLIGQSIEDNKNNVLRSVE